MTDFCKDHGHAFRPRYDLMAPKWLSEETRIDWLADSGVAIEHVFEKIYVCDICTRCGKRIDRQTPIDMKADAA